MDVLSLNLNGGGGFVLGSKRKAGLVALSHGATLAVAGWRAFAVEDLGFPGSAGIEVSVLTKAGGMPPRAYRCRSIVVRSIGKKKNHDGASSSGNSDPSNPEGGGVDDTNMDHKKSNSNNSSKKSHQSLSDWRDFRANLVALEQEQLVDPDFLSKHADPHNPSSKLGLKWAHPISAPETGCVLVATEKLDGVASFERTVVLLLRLGSRDPREGPFGIILNKPLHQKIKHMKPSNPHLANTFAECSLHRGGPLDANMFLFNTGNSTLPGFEKVVPGVCFGARNSLDEAAALIKKGMLKAQDFKFFIGYAGWQFDQLLDEIESGYWVVAACSSNLINGASADVSSKLWEEILQLMGGQYSELSRKPKQRQLLTVEFAML